VVKPFQRFFRVREDLGNDATILTDTYTEPIYRGWPANDCNLGIDPGLPHVLRDFRAEPIPLRSRKFTLHRAAIDENLINLLLRSDIADLLLQRHRLSQSSTCVVSF
jgi:hypothetical protein